MRDVPARHGLRRRALARIEHEGDRRQRRSIPRSRRALRRSDDGTKPDAEWTKVATTESDLLPTLEVCNKRSQGFYAEQIFKTLSAAKTGHGTWADSVVLVKEFLGRGS